MTIVDRQHAAQVVTQKGKAYKFDAAECMIHSLQDLGIASISHFLVTDYSTPDQLIDAQSATFLVSPNITSPMRANLCALSSQGMAIDLREEKTGELYTWEEIQKYILEHMEFQ
ncbi:MAG: hypothetical protein Aureis2KO_32720 [Aureisphaera sp.]